MQQVARGFIADEDEEDEEEKAARRERRRERKKRRREEREEEDEVLDEEDLDLIGITQPDRQDEQVGHVDSRWKIGLTSL